MKQKVKRVGNLNQGAVNNLLEQEPNARFLFLPVALEAHLYRWGQNHYDTAYYQRQIRDINAKYDKKLNKTDKEKRIRRLTNAREKKLSKWDRQINEGNWRMRIGAPLAVFDTTKHERSQSKLDQYLVNEGYFEGQTAINMKPRGKKFVEVAYEMNLGPQYYFDSILYDIPDPAIQQIVLSKSEQAIQQGAPYQQRALTSERDRIYDLLTDEGYFDFSRQYIFFKLDTISLEKPAILLQTVIANPPNDQKHKQFVIDSVSFVGEAINGGERTTITHKGIVFQFGLNRYNKELLQRRFFIKKDSLYRRSNSLETRKQLANLDAFKFININYDTTGGNFIATVFTSPLNKYQTSYEAGLSSIQGLPGPFFNVGLKNRNTFRGMEYLELNGNMTLQGIQSISDQEGLTRNYTLLQYGGVLSINFPQFIFPLKDKTRDRFSRFNPRTSISFSYNFEDRLNEYRRRIIRSALTYRWQTKNDISYNLTPISIGFVDSNPTEAFQEFLDELRANGNGSYAASFESALISTASIDIVFNKNYGSRSVDSHLTRVFTESGGNFLNSVARPIFGADSVQYQYMKFRIDHRRQKILDEKSVLATRIHLGIAVPYGRDPVALPYEKYFYIGGSNSLRAWPARRLGPGDFAIYDDFEEGRDVQLVNYILEQGGDMILESSVELRKRFAGFMEWALFVDAGNIWQIQSSPLQPITGDPTTSGKSGRFQFDTFLREIAVGAGVGLRVDFGYLVFRVDGAVQVVDPAQAVGSRFVLDDVKFLSAFRRVRLPESQQGQELQRDKEFLQNKTRINIGIGLPF
ncbi:MAG: BamA/TamA family outer membrane protein [Bacteroidota bacterium]